MYKFTILSLLCINSYSLAQCGSGGCGSGSGGGGMTWSSGPQYQFNAPWEPPFTSADGRIYEKWTDGSWREKTIPNASQTFTGIRPRVGGACPCVCGCATTGSCLCETKKSQTALIVTKRL